jgi:integrase
MARKIKKAYVPPKKQIVLAESQIDIAEKRTAAFFKRHGLDEESEDRSKRPTAQNIKSALLEEQKRLKCRSWNNLLRFVLFDQHLKGYKKSVDLLKDLEYPRENGKPVQPETPTSRSQRKIVRNVSDKDHEKLMTNAPPHVKAALAISRAFGCRPEELHQIRKLSQTTYLIPSAKKTEDGLKGVDREVRIDLRASFALKQHFEELNSFYEGKDPSKAKNALTKALERHHKKVFPGKKKNFITLYSYRHMKASDLKVSGMTRKEIAYLMGHQSTASIDTYGSRKSGRAGRAGMTPEIMPERLEALIRENHDNGFLNSEVKHDIEASEDYEI